MCLETAQILSTALFTNGVAGVPYKPTHKKHPCCVWAAETKDNFDWLVIHGIALCDEYTRRFGKVHASRKVIEFCGAHSYLMPPGPITPFAQAMPDVYKDACAITAYRNYYKAQKASFATWTSKTGAEVEPPEWFLSVL